MEAGLMRSITRAEAQTGRELRYGHEQSIGARVLAMAHVATAMHMAESALRALSEATESSARMPDLKKETAR
jgi:hypothetical protein